MRSRIRTTAAMLTVLLGTGFVSDRLTGPAWEQMRTAEPVLNLEDVDETLGHGLTVGLLGGFRAVIADLLWLKTNTAWERQDLPVTQTLVRLVSAVDPRPLFFWINGARMIAYDMPVWRIQAAGGYRVVPERVQSRFHAEQATVALDHLRRALNFHPDHPLLYIEMAGIYQRRLDDLDAAARYFRLAAEQPGAPHYAARIHAELLRQTGRKREAYEWLTELHPTLDPADPYAMSHIVLSRIRRLEEELGVPAGQAYAPPKHQQNPGNIGNEVNK